LAPASYDLTPVKRFGKGVSVWPGKKAVRDAEMVGGACPREAVELDVPDEGAVPDRQHSAHDFPSL
jgi:hypothetical protein